MYVKEQHIEVNQSVQKIAANRTRKLLDAEVDWLLNKHMGRFIESRVTPKKDGSGGFEIKAFDIDAIRPLLMTGVEIPAYIADPRRVKAILPGDYSYLISDESTIKRTQVDLSGTIAAPAKATLQKNLLLIPVFPSALGTGPYYANIQVYINSGLVFDMQQYTQARNTVFSGFDSKDEVFFVSSLLLGTLAAKGWKVHWERFAERFYPKTLVVDLGPLTQTSSITIDGVTRQAATDTYYASELDYYQQLGEDQSNRLTASNIIQNIREVAFYKSQPESPISELAGQLLYTYTNTSFIVTSTRISYVRKPQRISLSLGTDCELAPEYHQLICDLVAEYFKAMIADPNWEVKLKDNMTRTPL